MYLKGALQVPNFGQAYQLDISYEARQAAKNGKLLGLPLETINPEALEKARMEAEINRLERINAMWVLSVAGASGLGFIALLAHYISPWVWACIPLALAVRWIREKLKRMRGI